MSSWVPGPPIPRLLVILFIFFFSIRPTNPISENAFNAKQKKRGWPNKTGISLGRLSLWLMCTDTFLPWITCHSEKLS